MMRFGDVSFDLGGDGRPLGDPIASFGQNKGLHAPIKVSGGGYALPTPVLLAGFETLTGVTKGGSGTMSLDTIRKVQGASALKLVGNGSAGGPTATLNIGTHDAATMGTIAAYINTNSDYTLQAITERFRVSPTGALTTATNGISNRSFGSATWDGGYWHVWNVNEEPSVLALGHVNMDLQIGVAQNAPIASDVTIDCVMKNAAGRPEFIIYFDDVEDSIYDIALPYMQARGVKGAIAVNPAGIDVSDGLKLFELKACYDAGWDAVVDSYDDSDFTAMGTVAAAVANAQSIQTWLAANGMTRGADHGVFPFGTFQQQGVIINVAALTGDGSNIASVPSTAGITVGMTVLRGDLPRGTVVTNVDADGLHVTLSNVVPAATLAARFNDQTGAFYGPKFINGLAAAGFKTFRTTFAESLYVRFGFAEGAALRVPSFGMTGATWTTLKAYIDQCVLRGTLGTFYIHRLVAGGINMDPALFYQMIDYLVALRDAGIIDIITPTENWIRRQAAVLLF
jgi:hypothetical protein